MKTNALRLLDTLHIPYETREYAWSEDELDAVTAAHKVGLPPEQVFKTLVLEGDVAAHNPARYFVCILPADAELDLKKAARASGNKSAAMLPLKQLTLITGYVRGGCSPLGMKKQFPTFIEETAQLFDIISVSPGMRGLQMLLSPHDLARAAEAQFAPLI
jgi:Cys-tRNA(Pro)/Cys-tRNA(Cys) deacylase